MNHITLTGTVKGEVRHQITQSGVALTRFNFKAPRTNGKGHDFFTVKMWRDLATKASNELTDGMALALGGPHTNDRYQDQQSQEWRDAWTLHATGYEVLTGAAPAAGQSLGELLDEETPF